MRNVLSNRFSRYDAAFLAAAAGSIAAPVLAQVCPVQCPAANQIQICYEQGRVDNYALPFDPLTPRPLFAALLSTYAISKPFDDPTVNAVCGTSFQNLPCGIVSATLEIKMRAENDIPSNDSIYLQWNGATFAFGSNISALPGAGGTWNPGQNQTFTLPLSAAIINTMNITHALDVLVSDDTTVDYARLTIMVCPCDGQYRVYTVGGVDNMAPPTEATSRRARLTALRTTPGFLWKDNDDCNINLGWGHTFSSLPPGIVRASFDIRVMPCGSGSNNDSLNFDLLNVGAPDAFSRGFLMNSLAAPWVNPTNPLQNFTFNLGTTLPTTVCGLNLLGDFGDRTFDVYLQDDSGVDAARLRVQPCPPMRRYLGTPFTARGDAIINEFPAERRIQITNLGSTGQDGVEFDARGGDGTHWAFDPPCIHMLPLNSFFDIFLEADLDGDGQPEPLTSIRLDKHFPDGLWIKDSQCAPGVCKEWVLGNSQTGEETSLCMSCDDSVMSGDLLKEVRYAKGTPNAAGASVDMYLKFDGIRAMQASCCGHVIKNADYIIIKNAGLPTDNIEVASFSWGVSQPAAYAGVAMLDELVFYRGSAHTTPSGATNGLDTNPGNLVISNIGSSGQDGVIVKTQAADDWSMAFTTICAGTYEECNPSQPIQYDISFTGSLGGTPGQPVGNSHLSRNRPSFFDIFADLSGTGTTQTLVKVFDENGAMTGMAFLPGPITQLSADNGGTPSGCGKQAVVIDGWRTACLWWEWNQSGTFSIPGLPPLHGKQIRILAAHPAAPFDFVESATFRAAGMADIEITDEQNIQVTPPPTCFADFNMDGGIDGSDVSAFFEEWEAGGAGADVNQDGGIDGADVGEFYRQWSNGGC